MCLLLRRDARRADDRARAAARYHRSIPGQPARGQDVGSRLRLRRAGLDAPGVAAATDSSCRVDLCKGGRGAFGNERTGAQSQRGWRTPLKPSTAFDVCHEVYAAAREIVNTRMPTLQFDRASKFLWRPDLRPRLVEYVADFALAGARALGEDERGGGRAAPDKFSRELRVRWRPRRKSRELRASRLVLFRLYYLGGAEYQAARRLLGLSETSWSFWTEEIRKRVGRELLRAGMFPPSRYFREMSTPRRSPRGSNLAASCDPVGSRVEVETVAEQPPLG